MRVKVLLALAIASVLLIFTAGTAMACSNPNCCSSCTCGDKCVCTGDSPCCDACTCGTARDSVVSATTVPVTQVDGTAVAQALQKEAFAASSADAFGFPVLDGITADALGAQTDLEAVGLINSIDACPLNTLDCDGDCGVCPECTCEERLTTFQGPIVNLGCPVVNTVPQRVDLVSPVIKPEFPTINIAPQATIALPQVNAKLNCFDIDCGDCGCPVVDNDRKDKVR